MRTILSLSLPQKERTELESRAKKANKTLSAYVLNALAIMKELISEEELLEIAKQAKTDYKDGKTKVVSLLEDLMEH